MQRNYQKCAILNCERRYNLNPDIKYFCFPTNNKKCLAWLEVINNRHLSNMTLTTIRHSYTVCERHFNIRQFQTPQCLKLNRNALPTLYLSENGNHETQPELATFTDNSMQPQQNTNSVEIKGSEIGTEEMCTATSPVTECYRKLSPFPHEAHMGLSTPVTSIGISGEAIPEDDPIASTSKGPDFTTDKLRTYSSCLIKSLLPKEDIKGHWSF